MFISTTALARHLIPTSSAHRAARQRRTGRKPAAALIARHIKNKIKYGAKNSGWRRGHETRQPSRCLAAKTWKMTLAEGRRRKTARRRLRHDAVSEEEKRRMPRRRAAGARASLTRLFVSKSRDVVRGAIGHHVNIASTSAAEGFAAARLVMKNGRSLRFRARLCNMRCAQALYRRGWADRGRRKWRSVRVCWRCRYPAYRAIHHAAAGSGGRQ